MSRWTARPDGWTGSRRLSAQQRLLQRLLDWSDRDNVQWLTVGRSLERGNADWLSDLERRDRGQVGALRGGTRSRFHQALDALGDLVDLLPPAAKLSPAPVLRQYRDRARVDLTVGWRPLSTCPAALCSMTPKAQSI